MSKKVFIVIGAIFGGLIVLSAVAALLIKLLVTPEMVRKYVVPRAEKALDRRIELSEVKIGLFSGIELGHMTMYERDGKTAFVSADIARLRYQILPLLSRRVVVDEIVLEAPHIHIVRNSDGSFNFSDLLKKEKLKPAEKEEQKRSRFSFAVAKITVSDGRVVYDDRKGILGSPFMYELHDIGIDVKNFAPDHPFPVTIKAAVPGASMAFSGTVERISDGSALSGQFTLADMDLAKFTAGLPKGISAKIAKLSPAGGVTAKIQVAGEVRSPVAMLKDGVINLKDVRVLAGGKPAVLKGTLTLSKTSIASRDLKVAFGNNELAAQLKTSSLETKPIHAELSLSGEKLDLDVLLSKKQGQTPGLAPARATGEEPGPVNVPVVIGGGVRIGSVTYRGVGVSGFSLRYRLVDNVLNIEDMKGSIAGGNFSDTARINLGLRGYSYSTRLAVHGVQADKVVPMFAPKAAGTISGALSATADLSGHGTKPDAMKRNLTGSGKFNVRNGKLTGRGFMTELSRFLGSEELRIVRFSTFDGTYRVGGGQVVVDAELNGSDIKMKPKGTIGFDKSLNMNIDTRVAPRIIGKVARGTVGSLITDEQGWGIIPLKATGTVGSPHFSLSGEAIGRKLKEKAGEAIRKELERKILKKEGTEQKPEQQLLEKTLKGIFGK